MALTRIPRRCFRFIHPFQSEARRRIVSAISLIAFFTVFGAPVPVVSLAGLDPKEALSQEIFDVDTRPWGSATLGVHANEREVRGSVRVLVPLWSDEDDLVFVYPYASGLDAGAHTHSVGLGYRHLFDDPELILGGSLWYDAMETSHENWIHQFSGGVELLTHWFDLRSNFYLPEDVRHQIGSDQVSSVSSSTESSTSLLSSTVSGDSGVFFQGNNLLTGQVITNRYRTTTRTTSERTDQTFERFEAPMRGFDVEGGVLIPWLDRFAEVRLYGGYYNFDNEFGGNIEGFKSRLEARIGNYVILDAAYYEDPEIIGSEWYAGFRVHIPIGKRSFSVGPSGAVSGHVGPIASGDVGKTMVRRENRLARRMQDDVIREFWPVVNESEWLLTDERTEITVEESENVLSETINNQVILTLGGNPITVTHIDSNATGSNGTFEDPFVLFPSTQGTDIIYVHSGSVLNGRYVLAPNQRLLGEGDGNRHRVRTDQLGVIALPAGRNLSGARPVIQNPTGVGVDAAAGSEISNFAITNTLAGVRGNNLSGNVNVNRMILAGNRVGIEVNGGSGNISFSDVAITDSQVAGVSVNGGSANLDFSDVNNPDAGFYGPSTITQHVDGSVFEITGGHSGSVTFAAGSAINATSGNGLQFNDADGSYDFNGVTTLDGTDAGIAIVGGTGQFAFGDTHIVDTVAAAAIEINGGSSTVNFGAASSISQNQNQAALSIVGGHTGSFTQQAGSAISATNGTGLQFVDADGIYSFNGNSTLNGGDAGIDILGGSGGIFTFADTTITNSTGIAVNIEPGSGLATFVNLDVNQAVGGGLVTNGFGLVTVQSGEIDGVTGDGISATNNPLIVGSALPSGVILGAGSPITGDAIRVDSTDATNRIANILNSSSADIGGRGIVINSTGTGTLSATLSGNDIESTGFALQTMDGGATGSLVLAIDNNTWQSNTAAQPTVEVTGGGLNSTIVTSLNANIVTANGTNGGVLFDRVTFDASGAALSGTQATATGITQIGQGAAANERVQGDGLSFLNPTGDLNIATLNIFNNAGTGLEVDTKGLGTTFNLVTGGGSINTVGGPAMFLDPLTGDITFSSVTSTNSVVLDSTPAQASGNGTGVTVDGLAASGGAGTNALNIGTLNVTNSASHGALIQNNGASNISIGTIGGATISNAGGNGIELDNNNILTAITFGSTNIDLGATAGTAGINYTGSNGATTFGATTITDVGNAANQVGINFNGATLTGTAAYESVAISGPDTSTTSIGVDLTGLAGNQIVNLGSQVNPATGPSSSITDLHRGVAIDNTAAVQFRFGDGEDTEDMGSSIDVNGLAGSFTVDAGGGTFAASNFNFDDVVFGAGDSANFPAAGGSAIFVSTSGGLVTADGINGLSQDVNTISVADALVLMDSGATFVFVGTGMNNTIDVSAGGDTGFSLDLGQSIDGFLNGNTVSFGQLQPANITGDFGLVGGDVTGNSALALNSFATADTVVTASGNHTIENNIFDGTGTVTSLIDVSGVAMDVTINGVDLQNIGVGDAGINLDGNSAAVTLTDVDLVGMNTGTALQIDATTASTMQITADASTDIDGTTGTVVSIGAGARDVNLGAVTIAANNNTDNVIDVTGQTGGTIIFGDVDITNFNDAAGTAVNLQGSGGTVTFADLDIATVAGAGLNVGGNTFVPGATPTISATTANALTMNGTSLSGGAATFDSVTSGGGASGIILANVIGSTTFTTIDIDDSSSHGISLSNADTVTIIGGTIDNTTADGINSANTNLTVAGVTLGGNAAVGGDGIHVVNTASSTVAINNTTVNAAVAGVTVDGSGGGTTMVTSLSGNIITNAGAGGMLFETITFDAGGSTNVTGGNTSLGSLITTTNVTGDGLRLNNVLGGISFGTLSIGNDTGTGLFIRDAGGKGGTFAFSNIGGTINTTNGTAMDIDPVAMNSTFASVSSTNANGQGSGGSSGINLDGISGGVTINGGSITGATGDSFRVNGGTASVTYSGGITHTTAGAAAVSVSGGHNTGTVTFNTGTISATNGTGLQFNNADGTYNFNGPATLNGGDAGVDILNGSGGNFIFVDTDITSPAGTGINFNGSGGNVSFGAGSLMTFATAGQAAVAISNQGAGSNFTYLGTINATNGTGLQFNNADGANNNFAGAISLNGGDAGIDILNGSAGTFTFGNTTITSPTGVALNVNGSTGNVNYNGGSITQNNAVSAVAVSNQTAGTVDINVAVTANTGTATGINLTTNTGSTINFDGGLDIDTTSGIGFNATGGGTINVTGAGSTVTTNGAAAAGVNIASTTLGSNGVTFESVNVSGGATNGIVLNNTGTTGGLSITGDGTASPVQGGNFSGGTIQNTTGSAILLTNTMNFSATQLRILSPVSGNHAILATNLSGTGNSLNSSTVSGWRGASTDAFRITNTGATSMTLTIDNSVFSNGGSTTNAADVGNDALILFAQGSSTNTINVLRSSFTQIAGDAIDVLAGDNAPSTSTVNLTVQGSSFTNAAADGNGGIQARAFSNGTLNATIGGAGVSDGNTFNDTHRLASTSGVIEIQGNDSGTVTAIVQGNNLDEFNQSGINVVADDNSNVFLRIEDNDIDTSFSDRIGIRGSIRNTGETDIEILNNRIGQVTPLPSTVGTRSAIDLEIFDMAGAGAAENVQILLSGNLATINSTSASSETVDIFVDENAQVDLTVLNNTFINLGAGIEFRAEIDNFGGGGSVLNLNLGVGGANTADNDANPGNGFNGDFQLTQFGGTFNVQNLPSVGANNNGTVTTTGTINNIAGPVPVPDAAP